MTKDELIYQKQLLEALLRKCKSDALYLWTKKGIEIINRELDSIKMIEEYDKEDRTG